MLKAKAKEPKEKEEVYKGSKATPRHPQPGAQTVFQVPAAPTPRTWSGRKRKEGREEEEE